MRDIEFPDSNQMYYKIKHFEANPDEKELLIIRALIKSSFEDEVILDFAMSASSKKYLKSKGYKILSSFTIKIVERLGNN